ncbi:MAG: hypothetical protein HWN81_00295 [Candidatus Lokiarchaeota archaeon]|nr:hypothetical protein [Candidatus Lokiarchaeota archaeon]
MKVLMGNGVFRLVLKDGCIEVQQRMFYFWEDTWQWVYGSYTERLFHIFIEFKKDIKKESGNTVNIGCQTLELDKACELYVLLEDYFKYLLEE